MVHRIRLVPQLDSRRSLRFEAISREVKEGDPPLRIGRFTDRSGLGLAAVNALGSNKLAFKSKVVSRAHAEIWVEGNGFYIKDTKSSSGTFLNHVRLSPANTESRPHPIKDGDVLQLGVDYQGGAEDIYKSVKIRVEVGREWQAGANAFKCVAYLANRLIA
jgi:pSer/pThr/pTyr-binding forkhead associated (FHA) protein